MEQTNNMVKTETTMKNLYKVGAAAAFLVAFVFRRNWSAEADILLSIDIPVSATEWFNLIQENRLLGIIMLNFFDMVNIALVGVVFFTLFYALKDSNAFALLSLSDRYFAASEADKSIFLSAGEALLTINDQGSGIYISMFLIGLSGLIISIIMLQSNVFSRKTAHFGILANGVGLSYFITIIILPTIGWIPIPLSAIALLIWYILIGVRLYQLSKE
ncbi:MAG: hypothetical protein ACW97W_08375 [Candidatus Hodarchaeales archaeon]|jgi:hypothetical protein